MWTMMLLKILFWSAFLLKVDKDGRYRSVFQRSMVQNYIFNQL